MNNVNVIIGPTMTAITIINPFSGAVVERDAAEFTAADLEAYVNLLDDEEADALEGAESPEEWIVEMVDLIGPERAGIIILGS